MSKCNLTGYFRTHMHIKLVVDLTFNLTLKSKWIVFMKWETWWVVKKFLIKEFICERKKQNYFSLRSEFL